MNLIIIFDICIYSAILLILISNNISKYLDKKVQTVKWLNYLKNGILIVLLIEICCSCLSYFKNPDLNNYMFVAYSLLLISGMSFAYLQVTFIYKYMNKEKYLSKAMHLFHIMPVILCGICLVINIPTKFMFKVTSEATYERQIGFIIYYILGFYTIALSLVYVLKDIKNLNKREKNVFVLITGIPVIGMLFQNVFPGAPILWPLAAISAASIYLFSNVKYKSIDLLTGFINQKTFCQKIYELDKNMKFGIVYIDLDDFTSIIKDYGFYEGENALVAFASNTKSALNFDTTICRIDDDEFYILFEDATKEMIENELLKVQNAIRNLNMKTNKPYSISFTYVYEIFSKDKYDTPVDLVKYLKHLLYVEKNKKIV